LRLGVLSIHVAGEGHNTHKGAIAPLGGVVITVVSLRRLLLLRADHQALIRDLDRVVIPLQLGDVLRHDEFAISLFNVQARRP
jgi:hypothetical protein